MLQIGAVLRLISSIHPARTKKKHTHTLLLNLWFLRFAQNLTNNYNSYGRSKFSTFLQKSKTFDFLQNCRCFFTLKLFTFVPVEKSFKQITAEQVGTYVKLEFFR